MNGFDTYGMDETAMQNELDEVAAERRTGAWKRCDTEPPPMERDEWGNLESRGVLLYCRDGYMCMGWCRKNAEEPWDWPLEWIQAGRDGFPGLRGCFVHPSHWMSLPEPPGT